MNTEQRRTKADQRRDAQVEKTDGGMRNMGVFNFNLSFFSSHCSATGHWLRAPNWLLSLIYSYLQCCTRRICSKVILLT